jgi:hypothetical protein
MELTLRARLVDRNDPPGAHARLLLAGPDGFRLRVESAFGTALDVSGRGDTVMAYIPPERLAMVIESASDTLGVRFPGALGYRLWSGTWDPPTDAWRDAEWRDSLIVLRWTEEDDSLAMAVGSTGLPRSLEVSRGRGKVVRVDYRAWSSTERTWWPAWIEISDRDQRNQATCRIQRVRFVRPPPGRARLMIRIPADAEPVSWSELRMALERWTP